jgi:ketosteroid isomerase-like protein
MELSEEERHILAVIYELLDAQEASNVGRMRATLSDCPEAAHMATDGLRWETSNEAANTVTATPPGLRLMADHFDVHLHGDVAWAEGLGRIINPSGDQRPVRISGVLVREQGRWMIVQSHASLPVRDADIFKLAGLNSAG